MNDHDQRITDAPAIRGLSAARSRTPPVERWHPPLSGDIDIVIGRSGGWRHEGVEINRLELVRLFASILRREEDGHHYLVTPVEKWRIAVEDAPLIAVAMAVSGEGERRDVKIETNCGDGLVIGPSHPVRFDGLEDGGAFKAYVAVRHGLEALFTRALMHDLAGCLVEGQGEDAGWTGLWSGGTFWRAAPT